MKRILILLALCGLSVTAFAENVFLSWATWPDVADSAKVFVYSQDGSTVTDSTAGAARTTIRRYDTTIALNLTDSVYNVVVEIWLPGDTVIPFSQTYGDVNNIGSDTSAIKTMLAGNRDLVTGYTAAWFGTVSDAAPTTLAFVAAGSGSVSAFDLSRSDDFYNNAALVFISGNLKGRSQPITDWKTTQDSLINRGFFASPSNGDTFMVVAQGFPDVYAISGDIPAADSLEVGYDGTVTTVREFLNQINAEVDGVNGLTPLQASDNIGLNWGDVTNQGTSVNLSATTTNLVNTATSLTNKTGFALSGAGVEAIWDQISIRAIVEDSIGNNSNRIQTSLGEGTSSHYDNMLVMFISGAQEGQARKISRYNAVWGYIEWVDPVTAGGFAAGDSLVILPWGFVSVDSFSTSAVTADAIATDAIGASEIAADAIGASEVATNAIGADEIASSAIGVSEIAIDAISSLAIAPSAAAEVTDSVMGRLLLDGDSLIVDQSSLEDMTVATVTNLTTNNDKTGYALSAAGVGAVWDEDSTGHYTSPNMAFVASQTGGGGSADTLAIARQVWRSTSADDSTYGAGTMGLNSKNWDATGSGGTGSNSVFIGATDTSGTDSIVSGVEITVRTLAGVSQGTQRSLSNGYTAWSLNADTFEVLSGGLQSSHIWDGIVDTIVVVSNPDTFAQASNVGNATDSILMGYDLDTGSPSAANTCVMSLYLGDISGATGIDLYGIPVTFTLPGRRFDTCASPVTIIANVSQTRTTDTLGIVQVELRYSACVEGTDYKGTDYKMTIDHPSFTNKTWDITVPSQATYTITASDLQ